MNPRPPGATLNYYNYNLHIKFIYKLKFNVSNPHYVYKSSYKEIYKIIQLN